MEKVNFQKVFNDVKYHVCIMARGFARTLYGTAVTALILAAGYGFVVTQSEAGYTAVCDFVASATMLAIALCNMYLIGKKKRGVKK